MSASPLLTYKLFIFISFATLSNPPIWSACGCAANTYSNSDIPCFFMYDETKASSSLSPPSISAALLSFIINIASEFPVSISEFLHLMLTFPLEMLNYRYHLYFHYYFDYSCLHSELGYYNLLSLMDSHFLYCLLYSLFEYILKHI